MNRLVRLDRAVLLWCNRRLSSRPLDWLFGWMTHLGGATFTIACAVGLTLFAGAGVTRTGLQSAAALTVSHLIAAWIKRKVRRDRPFRKLEQVKAGAFPLHDYSFPSGHTTAIFALIIPLAVLLPSPAALGLIALALLVALSRVYWGYHYPLDCAAGGLLGSGTALVAVVLIGSGA